MLRVLVVDDMPIFVAFMETLIPWEAHGFQLVGSAKDGQEALAMAKESQPNIVLTDITMPHMDGLSLAEALKAVLPDVSIVMITGHTEFQYAHSALRLGVSDYLVKPFEAQELLITLLKLKQAHQKSADVRLQYADLEALRTATLLRQLLLSQTLDVQLNRALLNADKLPLMSSLSEAYGIRVATIAFPSEANDRPSIERILTETLADGRAIYQFTDYDDHLVVLLCYPDPKDHAFYRDDIDHLVHGISQKLALTVHLGISPYQPLNKRVLDQGSPLELSSPVDQGTALAQVAPVLKRAYQQALDQLNHYLGQHMQNPVLKRQRIALEMKAFLDGHFTEPTLGMDTVSKALLVNQTDLRAAFKSEMGSTMTEYILKCRMERARELISTGEHKLSNVAELVGYEDQAYFSRCYKRYFGTAPNKHGPK